MALTDLAALAKLGKKHQITTVVDNTFASAYHTRPIADFGIGIRSDNSHLLLICFVLICFVLICFDLFCFVLFCFVLFCFVLFCFVLFCFVLFCFVLFCFVLFCFVLFCFVFIYSF